MKKRILISVILIICVLTLATACERPYDHEHLLVMREAKEATCTQSGNDLHYECKKCHKLFLDDKGENPTEYESVTKKKLAHTPKAEWQYGSRNHFHRCEVCGEKVMESEAAHNYGEDKLCVICDYKKPSSGLKYRLFGGRGYSLIEIGDCTDVDVVIPSMYENIPVTEINFNAFLNCGTIQSIYIPNSVTYIGEQAFAGCKSLKSINIPSGVTKIDAGAFYECESLKSIDIPKSVTKIERDVFYGCSSLRSVNIPDSVTSMGDRVFYGCSSLQSVNIPDSVTSIGWTAFSGCTSLQSIVIGNGITKIDIGAFEGCENLQYVYYRGSAEEWNEISIDGDNDELKNATIYYYSATEPVGDGTAYNSNYWHYDESGEIAVWKNEL